MCLKSILIFYTDVPAAHLLLSSNRPVGLEKKKLVARWNLVCCTCINSVWTIPQLYGWRNILQKHVCFCPFHNVYEAGIFIYSGKSIGLLFSPSQARFCPYMCICCKTKPDLGMHDICFFNRKWQNCIAITFHHFWGFWFVNSCNLSCFL